MFHVHVYKVVRKAEIDVTTTDEKGAMEVALEKARRSELEFGQWDCEFIAVAFEKMERDKSGR